MNYVNFFYFYDFSYIFLDPKQPILLLAIVRGKNDSKNRRKMNHHIDELCHFILLL